MARTHQGILGNVSGRIGNVVGGAWKGIGYLRSYVIPNNPQSAGQTIQRTKMSVLVACAKSMLVTIIQKFWDPFALGMSGFNTFVKANKGTKGVAIDFTEVLASQGQLEQPVLSAITYDVPNVVIPFSAACLSNGLATDKIVGLVYDKLNHVAFVVDTGTARSVATISVPVGASRLSANLQATAFAYRGTAPDMMVSSALFAEVQDA